MVYESFVDVEADFLIVPVHFKTYEFHLRRHLTL